MNNLMVEVRIRAALKHVLPQFEDIESPEPSLEDIIFQYYSANFSDGLAYKYTDLYMAKFVKELTEMIDVEG